MGGVAWRGVGGQNSEEGVGGQNGKEGRSSEERGV